METAYWIVKFYIGKSWVGGFYVDLEKAKKGFDSAASGLGNPNLVYRADLLIAINHTPIVVGETKLGPMDIFDKIELVELSGFTEKILDSASREAVSPP